MLNAISESSRFEKGFGGDASPQHACSAESFLFDNADGEAELGASDGTHVPGGSAAEENDVK
jgi:hypothetical protein